MISSSHVIIIFLLWHPSDCLSQGTSLKGWDFLLMSGNYSQMRPGVIHNDGCLVFPLGSDLVPLPVLVPVLTTLASDIGVTCRSELWRRVGEEGISISLTLFHSWRHWCLLKTTRPRCSCCSFANDLLLRTIRHHTDASVCPSFLSSPFCLVWVLSWYITVP